MSLVVSDEVDAMLSKSRKNCAKKKQSWSGPVNVVVGYVPFVIYNSNQK